MISGLRKLKAHFARFPVTEISLRKPALEQFDIEKILQARACWRMRSSCDRMERHLIRLAWLR